MGCHPVGTMSEGSARLTLVRCFSTMLNEAQFNRDWVELALSHSTIRFAVSSSGSLIATN